MPPWGGGVGADEASSSASCRPARREDHRGVAPTVNTPAQAGHAKRGNVGGRGDHHAGDYHLVAHHREAVEGAGLRSSLSSVQSWLSSPAANDAGRDRFNRRHHEGQGEPFHISPEQHDEVRTVCNLFKVGFVQNYDYLASILEDFDYFSLGVGVRWTPEIPSLENRIPNLHFVESRTRQNFATVEKGCNRSPARRHALNAA